MSSKLLLQLNSFIQRIENVLPMLFGRGFPPGKQASTDPSNSQNINVFEKHELKRKHNLKIHSNLLVFLLLIEPMYALACPGYMPSIQQAQTSQPFSVKDLIGDGFLWAVPRTRRTIEKRLKRKFGNPKYHIKLMLPKLNLRTCMQCGHDHEVGVLCRKLTYCCLLTKMHSFFSHKN